MSNHKEEASRYGREMGIIEAAMGFSPPTSVDRPPKYVFRDHFNPVRVLELVVAERQLTKEAELRREAERERDELKSMLSIFVKQWESSGSINCKKFYEAKELLK